MNTEKNREDWVWKKPCAIIPRFFFWQFSFYESIWFLRSVRERHKACQPSTGFNSQWYHSIPQLLSSKDIQLVLRGLKIVLGVKVVRVDAELVVLIGVVWCVVVCLWYIENSDSRWWLTGDDKVAYQFAAIQFCRQICLIYVYVMKMLYKTWYFMKFFKQRMTKLGL